MASLMTIKVLCASHTSVECSISQYNHASVSCALLRAPAWDNSQQVSLLWIISDESTKVVYHMMEVAIRTSPDNGCGHGTLNGVENVRY